MVVEYAQRQLVIETIVYMANNNNFVRQTVDMLHGDFCVFLSFCVKQIFQMQCSGTGIET